MVWGGKTKVFVTECITSYTSWENFGNEVFRNILWILTSSFSDFRFQMGDYLPLHHETFSFLGYNHTTIMRVSEIVSQNHDTKGKIIGTSIVVTQDQRPKTRLCFVLGESSILEASSGKHCQSLTPNGCFEGFQRRRQDYGTRNGRVMRNGARSGFDTSQ